MTGNVSPLNSIPCIEKNFPETWTKLPVFSSNPQELRLFREFGVDDDVQETGDPYSGTLDFLLHISL